MVIEDSLDNSDDWMTALLRSPIFQQLPPVNLQKIIMKLEPIDFKKGEVIISQGSEGDYFYLIKKGHCVLTRKSSPTAKEIKLRQLTAGDAFGEDALISGAPRDLTITALTDIALLRLDKQNFVSLVKEPTLKFVDYDEMEAAIKQGAIVMDVRTPDEYEVGHLEGSINQPFFSLRMMLKSLNHEKSYIIVCSKGKTSEAAAYLLLKNNIEAKILKGGIEGTSPEKKNEIFHPNTDDELIVEDLKQDQQIDNAAELKSFFFQQFDPLIDDFCMRIDHEFGLQLGKNREKITKEQYMKLLEYLRLIRKDIKQDYLLKVKDSFDGGLQKAPNNQDKQVCFSNVSLLSDEAVKENHVLAKIIQQCEHSYFKELTVLNKLILVQQGKQTIVESQNPLFPEKLIRALVDVVNPLKLNVDGRIALYKAFDDQVFSKMIFIYQGLIKYCETKGSIKLFGVEQADKTLMPVSEIKKQPSEEFGELQKKLSIWRLAHFPFAYDEMPVTGNGFYESYEIKQALQSLQLDKNDLKRPLKYRLLSKLEELSFNIKPKSIAKDDEDLLDMVSLIFSQIGQDELLLEPVKAAILKLENSFAAAVLGRYSLFSDQKNAAITLLNDLFTAGQFLNADDDRLMQERIINAVEKMTQKDGFEFSVWATEAVEFSSYFNKQQQHAQEAEQNAKQFMQNKQALASNKKIVAIALENSMKDKALPTAIVEFLRDVWSEVLLDVYAHKDEQPDQWEKSVQAMDELIISVMPPADDNERKKILKFLPGMIAQLRQGLKQISYDKSAQARFFKDLAVWHIILMDKKEVKKTLDDELDNKFAVTETIKVDAIADEYLSQAKALVEESWLAFNLESVRQWAKLLWKDKDSELMVFVGKSGAKLFEIQIDELAEKLRQGQASIIKFDQRTLTDRALSEIMGSVN